MSRLATCAVVFLIAFLIAPVPSLADTPVTILHSFSATGDGVFPEAGLALSGSTLFGTTEIGGTSSNGVLFRINTDGSGYSVVHNFVGDTNDGGHPISNLTIVGSTVFGTTSLGGASGDGTIFSISTGGSGYQVVRSFAGAFTDGSEPNALTPLGSTLFGTGGSGGTSVGGTIFSINTNGAGYTQYQNFGSAMNDGVFPNAALTQLGSKFYGTTAQGGGSGSIGTVFSVNTDGTGLAFLHKFLGGANDGTFAFSDLIAVGTKLYGTTNQGGASNKGIVFSFDTANSLFTMLHSFGSIANDGSQPVGGVTLVGSTLYGTTQVGGSSPTSGTIYSLNLDGTGYQVVHNFLGGFIDGSQPRADLTLVGNTLFGTTLGGGSTGNGTVFALAVPEPATWCLAAAAIAILASFASTQASRR
jgi:uncharacterized repeat protein (TIGR03803 family)